MGPQRTEAKFEYDRPINYDKRVGLLTRAPGTNKYVYRQLRGERLAWPHLMDLRRLGFFPLRV